MMPVPKIRVALVVFLSLPAAPSLAQQAITTPILTSVNNFRDVAGIAASVNGLSSGGSGYTNPVADDGVMRTGVFYRSNALTLNAADLATINTLGVRLDIDLRTPSEIAEAPDVVPAGATYVNVNVAGSNSVALTVTSVSASVSNMESANRSFVTDAGERAALRQVFLDLANASGAVDYHCSGGKDRTGWVSAMLESMAGVPSSTIMNDYLATNVYSAATINATLATLTRTYGASYAAAYAPLLGTQSSFLQAGLDQITASYGSVRAYLIEGLGLSLADIYVLRGKMVDYLALPGQASMVGNRAAGAALLNALQNSSLSGHYTAYNYYLQSSIDAGSLGPVPAQIGGQIYADSVAAQLRLPGQIEDAAAPNADGHDLAPGESRVWEANLAGVFGTSAANGNASANTRDAGPLIGFTHRSSPDVAFFGALGYDWGQVTGAGARADIRTFLLTGGVRYGLNGLENGPFVAAQSSLGFSEEHIKRSLDGGLGTAESRPNGRFASGRADIGYAIDAGVATLSPELGMRVAHAELDGAAETGSELALSTGASSHTNTSLLATLDVGFRPVAFAGGWSVVPHLMAGYERAIGSYKVRSTAALYGYNIEQLAAVQGRNLVKAGLGAEIRHGALGVTVAANGVSDTANSLGFGGRLQVGYRF